MNGAFQSYGDLFAELNRLQDSVGQCLGAGGVSSLRALLRRTFPAINVGSTPDAIEVLALAPAAWTRPNCRSPSTRACW
jgi:HSP20 family protein